jgi:hypothetical protein
LIGAGVSGKVAAKVPSRGENGKTWISAKRAFSQKAIVSFHSSSLSSGKPTMTSVVIAISGRIARIASSFVKKRGGVVTPFHPFQNARGARLKRDVKMIHHLWEIPEQGKHLLIDLALFDGRNP